MINFLIFVVEMMFVVLPGLIAWPSIQQRVIVHKNFTCSSADNTTFLPPDFHIDAVTVQDVEMYWDAQEPSKAAFEAMPTDSSFANNLIG